MTCGTNEAHQFEAARENDPSGTPLLAVAAGALEPVSARPLAKTAPPEASGPEYSDPYLRVTLAGLTLREQRPGRLLVLMALVVDLPDPPAPTATDRDVPFAQSA